MKNTKWVRAVVGAGLSMALAFSVVGCAGTAGSTTTNADTSTSSAPKTTKVVTKPKKVTAPKDISKMTEQEKIMWQGPTSSSEWKAIIPDYTSVCKSATVTQETAQDDGYVIKLSDVSVDEYKAYVEQSEKIYPDVANNSVLTVDGQTHSATILHDKDGKYDFTVTLEQDVTIDGNGHLVYCTHDDQTPLYAMTIICSYASDDD